jgi:hypothetical protein
MSSVHHLEAIVYCLDWLFCTRDSDRRERTRIFMKEQALGPGSATGNERNVDNWWVITRAARAEAEVGRIHIIIREVFQ